MPTTAPHGHVSPGDLHLPHQVPQLQATSPLHLEPRNLEQSLISHPAPFLNAIAVHPFPSTGSAPLNQTSPSPCPSRSHLQFCNRPFHPVYTSSVGPPQISSYFDPSVNTATAIAPHPYADVPPAYIHFQPPSQQLSGIVSHQLVLQSPLQPALPIASSEYPKRSNQSTLANTGHFSRRRARNAPRKTPNPFRRRKPVPTKSIPANTAVTEARPTSIGNSTAITNISQITDQAVMPAQRALTHHGDIGEDGYLDAVVDPSHETTRKKVGDFHHGNSNVVAGDVDPTLSTRPGVDLQSDQIQQNHRNGQEGGSVGTDDAADKTSPKIMSARRRLGELNGTSVMNADAPEQLGENGPVQSLQAMTSKEIQDVSSSRDLSVVDMRRPAQAPFIFNGAPEKASLKSTDTPGCPQGPVERNNIMAAVTPVEARNMCQGEGRMPGSDGFRGASLNCFGHFGLTPVTPVDTDPSTLPARISPALTNQLSQVSPQSNGHADNSRRDSSQDHPASPHLQDELSPNGRYIGFSGRPSADALQLAQPTTSSTSPVPHAARAESPNSPNQLLNPSLQGDTPEQLIRQPMMNIRAKKSPTSSDSRRKDIEEAGLKRNAAPWIPISSERVHPGSLVGSDPSLSSDAYNGNAIISRDGHAGNPGEVGIQGGSKGLESANQTALTARSDTPVTRNPQSKQTDPKSIQKCNRQMKYLQRGRSNGAALPRDSRLTTDKGRRQSNGSSVGNAISMLGGSFATAEDSEQVTFHVPESNKFVRKRSQKSDTPPQEKRARLMPRKVDATVAVPMKQIFGKRSQDHEPLARTEKGNGDYCDHAEAVDETSKDRSGLSQQPAIVNQHQAVVRLGLMNATPNNVCPSRKDALPHASKSSNHVTQQLPKELTLTCAAKGLCLSISPHPPRGPRDAISRQTQCPPTREPRKSTNSSLGMDPRFDSSLVSSTLAQNIGSIHEDGKLYSTKKDDLAIMPTPPALSHTGPQTGNNILSRTSSACQMQSRVPHPGFIEPSTEHLPTPPNGVNHISADLVDFPHLTQIASSSKSKSTGGGEQRQNSPFELGVPEVLPTVPSGDDIIQKQIDSLNVPDPNNGDLKTDVGRKVGDNVLEQTQKQTSCKAASLSAGSVASRIERGLGNPRSGISKSNLASACAEGRAGNNAVSKEVQNACATEFLKQPMIQAMTAAPGQNTVSVCQLAQTSISASNVAHHVQQNVTAVGDSSSSSQAMLSFPTLISGTSDRADKDTAKASSPELSSLEKKPLRKESAKAKADASDEEVLNGVCNKSSLLSSVAHTGRDNAIKATLASTPAQDKNGAKNSEGLGATVPSQEVQTARILRLGSSSVPLNQADKDHTPPAEGKLTPPIQAIQPAQLKECRRAGKTSNAASMEDDVVTNSKPPLMLRLRIRKGAGSDKNIPASALDLKAKKSIRRTQRTTAKKVKVPSTDQATGIQGRSSTRANLGVTQRRKRQRVRRHQSRVLRKRKDGEGDHHHLGSETETDNSTLRTKGSTPMPGHNYKSPERQTDSSSSILEPADELNQRASEVDHPRTYPSSLTLPKAKSLPRKSGIASVQRREGSGHEDNSIRGKTAAADNDEGQILKQRSRCDDHATLGTGHARAIEVNCALCQKRMAMEDKATHPLFPIRSLIICSECRNFVRSRFDERHGHVHAEKCRLFVGVVAEMIRGLPPSGREAAKLTGLYSSLISESCDTVLKRARSYPVPYEMLLVMKAVFFKIGVTFKDRKLSIPNNEIVLPASEDLRFLIAEAIPRSLSDFEVGSTAGERAWLAVFGEKICLDEPLPSCRMVAKVLSLVGVHVEHCGECRWGPSSIGETCSVSLDVADVDQILSGALATKTNIQNVFPAANSCRTAKRNRIMREREVKNELIFRSTDMSCCICTASKEAEGFPFRMLKCSTCLRKFCSLCLTNVLGSVEYIRASTAAESYSCMLCRTKSFRTSPQKNTAVEEGNAGIKKNGKTRRGGVRSNFLPMLLLSPAMRNELWSAHDLSMNNPAVRFAKQCEALNFKQLSYVWGEGRKSRSIPDELCLRCRQPVRPSHIERIDRNSPTRKTSQDETVLKCTERNCTVVMHRRCHKGRKVTKTRGAFSGMVCPRHKCIKCQSKGEGRLLRCRTCPATFCRDHVEPRQVHIFSDKYIACADCKPNLSTPQMSIQRTVPMARMASETPNGNDVLATLSLRQRERQVAVQRLVGRLGEP